MQARPAMQRDSTPRLLDPKMGADQGVDDAPGQGSGLLCHADPGGDRLGEEQWRFGEPTGDGPFDSDGFGEGVGGREGDDGGGQRRSAEEADGKRWAAAAPAAGSRARAASSAEASGSWPPMAAAVAMMMH